MPQWPNSIFLWVLFGGFFTGQYTNGCGLYCERPVAGKVDEILISSDRVQMMHGFEGSPIKMSFYTRNHPPHW